METTKHFIIVDDDDADNFIAKRVIKKALPQSFITIFSEATNALKHIKTRQPNTDTERTVLFVDVNMPVMTGWEFLEHFERLDEKIKKSFRIYMLSASDNTNDKEKALANKNITGYIIKPLSEEILFSVIFNQKQKSNV